MTDIAASVARKPMRMGAQGDAVSTLQLALAGLGYKLKGTGYFGGATDTAVVDFQRISGLEADGVVGIKTATAIDQAVPPSISAVIEHIERPLWLIEALKWIGLHEGVGPSDNPVILDWARAEGGDIAKDYSHDSIAWCALFANMVLTKAGLKGTETLWALDFDNAWAWPNVKLAGAAVGAFAPMSRDGGGHIAIVIGRTRDGNLACVGGNQGDQVSIAAFPAKRPRSFRWPLGVTLPLSVGFNTLPLVNSFGVSIKES